MPRGDPEVDVARGDGDRDRLGGLEELQLDLEPLVGEIPALERDEARGVGGEAQGADGDLVGGRGGLRQERRAVEAETAPIAAAPIAAAPASRIQPRRLSAAQVSVVFMVVLPGAAPGSRSRSGRPWSTP